MDGVILVKLLKIILSLPIRIRAEILSNRFSILENLLIGCSQVKILVEKFIVNVFVLTFANIL